jgi:hypothetical protein
MGYARFVSHSSAEPHQTKHKREQLYFKARLYSGYCSPERAALLKPAVASVPLIRWNFPQTEAQASLEAALKETSEE